MEEKGGATKKDGKYIESHHMLLIFMIVLNFVVLVLCLVFLGMQLYRREENIANMELENPWARLLTNPLVQTRMVVPA